MAKTMNVPAVETTGVMRQPTLATLGLGGVLDIFRRAKWIVLILAFLTNMVVMAMPAMGMSVLAKEISRSLELSLVQVGVVWGVGSFPMMITALIGGAVGDKLGPKRILVAGCLLIGGLGAARGLAGSFTSMVVIVILLGAFMPIEYYFDPKLTPPDLLPWLATWVDLVLDEQWPEAKRRQLLSAMVPLYRRRGTRGGLQDYLKIYTGRDVKITEHRAHNFQLGVANRLGHSVALGKSNVPHTFTVEVSMPPAPSLEVSKRRQRKIEGIIESEKPAHTTYMLILEETE